MLEAVGVYHKRSSVIAGSLRSAIAIVLLLLCYDCLFCDLSTVAIVHESGSDAFASGLLALPCYLRAARFCFPSVALR